MLTLKFLIDECLGISISKWLKDNNFDSISVIKEMASSSDIDVLNKAVTENRILITSDKDFGDMVFQKRLQHTGIILLRLQINTPKNHINVLEPLFKNHLNELSGNFIVVTDANIKIIKQKFN